MAELHSMDLSPDSWRNLFVGNPRGSQQISLLWVSSQPDVNMLEFLQRRLHSRGEVWKVVFIFILEVVSHPSPHEKASTDLLLLIVDRDLSAELEPLGLCRGSARFCCHIVRT